MYEFNFIQNFSFLKVVIVPSLKERIKKYQIIKNDNLFIENQNSVLIKFYLENFATSSHPKFFFKNLSIKELFIVNGK